MVVSSPAGLPGRAFRKGHSRTPEDVTGHGSPISSRVDGRVQVESYDMVPVRAPSRPRSARFSRESHYYDVDFQWTHRSWSHARSVYDKAKLSNRQRFSHERGALGQKAKGSGVESLLEGVIRELEIAVRESKNPALENSQHAPTSESRDGSHFAHPNRQFTPTAWSNASTPRARPSTPRARPSPPSGVSSTTEYRCRSGRDTAACAKVANRSFVPGCATPRGSEPPSQFLVEWRKAHASLEGDRERLASERAADAEKVQNFLLRQDAWQAEVESRRAEKEAPEEETEAVYVSEEQFDDFLRRQNVFQFMCEENILKALEDQDPPKRVRTGSEVEVEEQGFTQFLARQKKCADKIQARDQALKESTPRGKYSYPNDTSRRAAAVKIQQFLQRQFEYQLGTEMKEEEKDRQVTLALQAASPSAKFNAADWQLFLQRQDSWARERQYFVKKAVIAWWKRIEWFQTQSLEGRRRHYLDTHPNIPRLSRATTIRKFTERQEDWMEERDRYVNAVRDAAARKIATQWLALHPRKNYVSNDFVRPTSASSTRRAENLQARRLREEEERKEKKRRGLI